MFQQNVVKLIALDVQSRAIVAKGAEGELMDTAVPHRNATCFGQKSGLFHFRVLPDISINFQKCGIKLSPTIGRG